MLFRSGAFLAAAPPALPVPLWGSLRCLPEHSWAVIGCETPTPVRVREEPPPRADLPQAQHTEQTPNFRRDVIVGTALPSWRVHGSSPQGPGAEKWRKGATTPSEDLNVFSNLTQNFPLQHPRQIKESR